MLSEQIKSLRFAHHLTQVELAKELNVTKQTVSNWENDNIQPSIDMLVKLADFFAVTTDFLLDREVLTSINVQDLSNEEIAHINLIIKDLKKRIENKDLE